MEGILPSGKILEEGPFTNDELDQLQFNETEYYAEGVSSLKRCLKTTSSRI